MKFKKIKTMEVIRFYSVLKSIYTCYLICFSGKSANHDVPSSSSKQNEAPKRGFIGQNGTTDTSNEPGPSKRRKDGGSNKPNEETSARTPRHLDHNTRPGPNVSVLDEDGNLNIIVTREDFKRGSESINRSIANALREQDLAAARARGIAGNFRNIRVEFAREGEIEEDTTDEEEEKEDDGKAQDECNKRKIHDRAASSNDINQPGPSKRYKEEDKRDKDNTKQKRERDKLKKSKRKDNQNDNGQDSDNNDDNDDAPMERRRVCQIEVDAFLPDRPVYLMPNLNPEPGAYPWRIQARGGQNSAQNGERPVQHCENSSRNGENASRNTENSPENRPSTSRNSTASSQNKPSTSNSAAADNNALLGMPFMRYAGSCTVDLYNQEPVVIECSMVPHEVQEREGDQVNNEQREGNQEQVNESREQQDRPNNQEPPEQEERQAQQAPRESRQHILYVNLGRPQQANVFRLVQHTPRNDPQLALLQRHTHIQPYALISDAAVRRFGRADGEDIVVHIGPNGPYAGHRQNVGGRPDRSSLRVLSATGYRLITDRSLIHLVTAAPNLQRIDFSFTSVTERGVENFRILRPDCEVTYSKFECQDNDQNT